MARRSKENLSAVKAWIWEVLAAGSLLLLTLVGLPEAVGAVVAALLGLVLILMGVMAGGVGAGFLYAAAAADILAEVLTLIGVPADGAAGITLFFCVFLVPPLAGIGVMLGIASPRLSAAKNDAGRIRAGRLFLVAAVLTDLVVLLVGTQAPDNRALVFGSVIACEVVMLLAGFLCAAALAGVRAKPEEKEAKEELSARAEYDDRG